MSKKTPKQGSAMKEAEFPEMTLKKYVFETIRNIS